MTTETQAPDPAPRPFTAVKAFADSVLAMLDERIKAVDQAAHPFNDYFGDQPETIVAAKAQAGELREVRTQVRILADRALVELMKFRPAIPAPEGAQADERVAFERAYAEHMPQNTAVGGLKRAASGDYESAVTQIAWKMWRAALAAPAPQVPVALTDEQLTEILASHAGLWITPAQIARAVERAHGIPAPKEPTNDR